MLRSFKEQNLEEMSAKLRGDAGAFTPVPMIMEQGHLTFHHCRAVHGNDVNRSDSPRLSLSIHLQDGANRYRLYRNEQGVPLHLVDDDLCRATADGTPDYTDPEPFPVLWSDEEFDRTGDSGCTVTRTDRAQRSKL